MIVMEEVIAVTEVGMVEREEMVATKWWRGPEWRGGGN